jgi:hypothetical protein
MGRNKLCGKGNGCSVGSTEGCVAIDKGGKELGLQLLTVDTTKEG